MTENYDYQERMFVLHRDAAGRWILPEVEVSTLRGAREAGYRDKGPLDYGPDQVDFRGHILIRHGWKALSGAQWARKGFVIRRGETPFRVHTGRELWTHQQVREIAKTRKGAREA